MKLIVFLFIVLFYSNPLESREKICEIKRGYSNLIELKKELNSKSSLVKGIAPICSQIGLEHDQNVQPILSKPIYACCWNNT